MLMELNVWVRERGISLRRIQEMNVLRLGGGGHVWHEGGGRENGRAAVSLTGV